VLRHSAHIAVYQSLSVRAVASRVNCCITGDEY